MKPARLPFDETHRLAALRAFDVLDSRREAEFDAVVQVAAAQLLQAADAACYAAKEGGRSRVHLWSEDNAATHRRADDVQPAMFLPAVERLQRAPLVGRWVLQTSLHRPAPIDELLADGPAIAVPIASAKPLPSLGLRGGARVETSQALSAIGQQT